MAPLSEREAWIRLALTPGLSPRAAAKAVERAGGPVPVCAWSPQRLKDDFARRGEGPRQRPLDVALEPILARAEALGLRLLTPPDPDWPAKRFRGLDDPPPALFARGCLPTPDTPAAAVVGTRKATPYGLRVARGMAEALARRGVCVVSGLALGIDAAAHAGALDARAAWPATVAVLGNGLAAPYPPENAALSDAVAACGALLSEHPPDAPPEAWHFPRRNRIVAALADVVVVVEAPERSGALDTAGHAVAIGREVLAVPGPVDRFTHVGCHRLLHDQVARLCRGVDDVLAALKLEAPGAPGAGGGIDAATPTAGLPPPGPQLALWTLLDPDEAQDADALCRRSALPASEVSAALAALELDGRAVRVPGVGYRRR